jgi:hypothetical protein
MVWIESQSILVIVIVMFTLCYALAALIFLLVVALSRRRIGAELKATTPVMLTPLGIIGGLVIAFLASHVWANVDRASAFVAQEASAIRETVLLVDKLPATVRGETREALKAYLQFIETNDWPAMAEGRANLRRLPMGLPDAMNALLAFTPAGAGQQVAQQRAVIAVEQALEARRNRILLSEGTLSPLQWVVVFVLDALFLMIIGVVHIDRPVAAAFNLAALSTAVAACLVLLMVNDRPFASGGVTLQPTALREVGLD